MPWVRLEDDVYDNAKIQSVSRAVRWSYVAGIAFANRNRTGGELPRYALGALGATSRDAGALVTAGLWVPAEDGGWEIHDYGQYQPIDGELRAKRAAAGRKGAQARWHPRVVQ